MPTEEIYKMIVDMLPVIIGGIMALSGGVLTSILTHKMESGRQKKKINAEKAEKIVDLLYCNMMWLSYHHFKTPISAEMPSSSPNISVV